MNTKQKPVWINPFSSHPALRALYYPAWVVAILAAMTIVNSTSRYNSMPPVDFVIALIIPVVLFLVRTRLSVTNDVTEYKQGQEFGLGTLSVSHRLIGIPLYSKEHLFDQIEVNTSIKHPQIEFYRQGTLVYCYQVANKSKVSDLVLALAPEKLNELISNP